MFFAYNNGLAATADHIELDESGHFISRINNLQIVNGGQTTASIYYTQKKVNDADFTANNQALIEFEKLSRYILTPLSSDRPLQTYWFFERARGNTRHSGKRKASQSHVRMLSTKSTPKDKSSIE